MVMLLLFGRPSSEWDQNHIGVDREAGYFLIQIDNITTFYHTYYLDITNLNAQVDSNDVIFFESFEDMNVWIGQRTREDAEMVDDLIQMLTNYCDFENQFHN